MKRIVFPFLGVVCVLAVTFFQSCASSRDQFVYFKDMEKGIPYDIQGKRMIVIQPGDRLNISVGALQQDLTLPFNQRTGTQIENGRVSASSSSVDSRPAAGYLVDAEGYIDFPVLGPLQVGGMTMPEISKMIKDKIVQGKYIPEPRVTVELLNFKVYVLGAAGGKVVTASDGQLNLVQAIAEIGDLGSNARLSNIRVVREVDGKRTVYEHDIRSKSIYDSPAFYLQQNDLVYVEQKYQQRDEITNTLRYTSIIMAGMSFATAVIYLFK